MYEDLAEAIARRLVSREETVCVAESSTGGLISANLLAVAGASRFFVGGSVVYTLASRRAFLDIDRERVKALKPLTEDMALVFAEAAKDKLQTVWGIAELGAAGPTGTPYGHGPGRSVIGIAGPRSASRLLETGTDNRLQNMQAFTRASLELMLEVLSED
jgi:PncC family amidohydrolase